eukprot:SAG31_NODE_30672_length_377_cov_1.485612_1_plen_72_part_10
MEGMLSLVQRNLNVRHREGSGLCIAIERRHYISSILSIFNSENTPVTGDFPQSSAAYWVVLAVANREIRDAY